MQLGSGGAEIPLLAAVAGQSHAGGPWKLDFPENCSKGHRLVY